MQLFSGNITLFSKNGIVKEAPASGQSFGMPAVFGRIGVTVR